MIIMQLKPEVEEHLRQAVTSRYGEYSWSLLQMTGGPALDQLKETLNNDPDPKGLIDLAAVEIDKNPALLTQASSNPASLANMAKRLRAEHPVSSGILGMVSTAVSALNPIGTAAASELGTVPEERRPPENYDRIVERLAGDVSAMQPVQGDTRESLAKRLKDEELALYPDDQKERILPLLTQALADSRISSLLDDKAKTLPAVAITQSGADERSQLIGQIVDQGLKIQNDPNIKKITEMGHQDPEIGRMIQNFTDIDVNEDPANYLAKLNKMSIEDLRKQKAMLDNAESWQSMAGIFASSPQWFAHASAVLANNVFGNVDVSSMFSGGLGNITSNLGGFLDGLANGIFQLIGEALKSFSGSGSDFGLGTLLSASNSGGQQTTNLAAVSEEITGVASAPVEAYDENGAPQGTAAPAPAPVAGGLQAARPATA